MTCPLVCGFSVRLVVRNATNTSTAWGLLPHPHEDTNSWCHHCLGTNSASENDISCEENSFYPLTSLRDPQGSVVHTLKTKPFGANLFR